MKKADTSLLYEHLREQTDDVYKEFQSEFEEKIASEEAEKSGISRIQALEQIVHKMNSDINRENMKYVGKVIESLDEHEIIESKKQNS